MRRIATASLLLGALIAPGCGGASDGTNDPSKLTPLTAEDKEQIRLRDAQVQDEEGSSFGKNAKKPPIRRG